MSSAPACMAMARPATLSLLLPKVPLNKWSLAICGATEQVVLAIGLRLMSHSTGAVSNIWTKSSEQYPSHDLSSCKK